MRPDAIPVLLFAGLALGACNTADRLAQVGQEPPQSAVQSPERLVGPEPVRLPMPQPRPEASQPHANSLWSPGSRAFFEDQRAGDIGDILTVVIEIDDQASLENRSSRSRNANESAGASALLGYEGSLSKVLPEAVSPENLVDAQSSGTYGGEGAVQRTETVELELAALVTQVLPNGNFVIAGRQEVRVNFENRILQVAGVIRPEDISSANKIYYDDIAEARIAYGGEGQLSDVQQPRYGQQIYDILFPF
ncbi:flagellar basal body L-ring protein [Rhodovibrio sodomensis]|uniref:Flagellar L-ring protein n=1 Tax=Rhodovibrio sodomensis TaxID=1088 RepID=A0ABS1DHR1_9PROT|nr:flagellar basal body L-ring protein FlgH [Rhodovibrio sodomensis]MBK1669546.1 flagellar basal body L-ring protein [Rhodovibrio sodomensis]